MSFAATWLNLEITILSEVKPHRERQILYDSIYMWNLKNDTNELIYITKTNSQTQKTNLWLPKGKGVEGGKNQKFGINRDKQQGLIIQHREPYQYPVINYNGKESEKEYIYYITQHCKSTILQLKKILQNSSFGITFFFKNLYWSIIALQWCVSLCFITK